MKNKEDLQIKQLLETELFQYEIDHKKQLLDVAKTNILNQQVLARIQYDKKRKSATTYNVGDLVAIKRTQLWTCVKLRPNFFGPYQNIAVQPNESYNFRKVSHHGFIYGKKKKGKRKIYTFFLVFLFPLPYYSLCFFFQYFYRVIFFINHIFSVVHILFFLLIF